MAIVTFYNCDPKEAPKTTMPAHLGANAVITCRGRLLLEKRRDSVPCPPPLSNPYGQVWEHASVLIRILELSVCGSVKISIR